MISAVAPTSSEQNLAPAPPTQLPSDVCDVWSHWGNKYRTRALILLVVNVILFAGVGNFAFWIRSGESLAPLMPGYWDDLIETVQFWGYTGKSLGTLLLEPINVQDVPMQIPILGLLLGTLIAVPILVSLLYRFWASVPFLAVVALLAVMPWLSLTLTLSCIIASVRPFRSRYPLMSALFGTAPTVLYLILASSGTREAVVGLIDPVERIKFVAPWVFAIVVATAQFAVVLTVARLIQYRPGPLTPLIAAMLALPVGLFEWNVGRDELHYRLLESLSRHYFSPVDASAALSERAQTEWRRHPLPRPSFDDLRESLEQKWQFELSGDVPPYQLDLARRQQEVALRCDYFIEQFPDSRYAGNALFLKARAFDMRVAPIEFQSNRWIRFHDDFPAAASRAVWQTLAVNRPGTILGAVAEIHLGQLEARDCSVERAIDRLTAGIRILSGQRPWSVDSQIAAGAMERPAPEYTLNLSVGQLLLDAHRLKDLLENYRDSAFGDEPLCGSRRESSHLPRGLLSLNPRHPSYAANLQRIRTQFPGSALDDNLALELANTQRDTAESIRQLEKCMQENPQGDARAEALFRLGLAYQKTNRTTQGESCFRTLVENHPDSIWSQFVALYSRNNYSLVFDRKPTKETP